MKLTSFRYKDKTVHFGFALEGRLYSFNHLTNTFGMNVPGLNTMYSYISDTRKAGEAARSVLDMLSGTDNPERLKICTVEEANLLPAVPEPAALLDFSLAPRHLANSARTLIKHEFPWPLSSVIGPIVARNKSKKPAGVLHYYKGNHNEISGQGDVIPWPAYTSYLDVEPELAFVTGLSTDQHGSPAPVIAGYCIFNDASARDVQLPEMTALGPTRSKDFSRSNGLGAFLVTPDEISDPLNIPVTITIGDRFTWKGTTAEYYATPGKVLEYCAGIFTVQPGTVIGMGTIPGCCGLDNDLWLMPGDRISIEFQGLGNLDQTIGHPEKPVKSRWGKRKDII
ncbi:MAG TPA: fumarylacetoacetate hydrolase family protein [Spirochaetota bacterium]|nr:fumarylacetoacetate hydrolase family protein [Spirochaetota bacterium]HPI90666.1 fumarylacetoacetate hydrolase family protein [Spirochaetota bacterium]HPR49682.1 fumarylacetoacetate hydrolase family protein [Spirochaetota bacterium]